MDASVRPGDVVTARGRTWTVVDRTPHPDCASVRLRGSPLQGGEMRTLLTPFDRLRAVARRDAWRRLRPRRWLHAVRRGAIDTHPFGGLRTAAGSRIDVLPYQLEPALAILRHGATRVLIADAVGLGKTIQAGLIVRELAAAQEEFRALIVTPAGLRAQWRQELAGHFDIASVNGDAAWLRAVRRTLPADVNPWSLSGIYVVSFDFLKRPEVLRPLEETTWDAVIVDEAHAAGPASDRRAAIDAVAARARRVVLLTATPHGGDPEQFESLCRLGQADQDRSPVVLFRRTTADAGRAVERRTVLLPIRLSPAERRMHRLLERYAGRVHREAQARGDARATLAAIVLRKRALSGATPLLTSVSRRLELLAGAAPAQARQLSLPLGDEDALDDEHPDDVLAAPGLGDVERESRDLERIRALAFRAAAAGETKMAFLLRLLRRIREPVIVFTEYRDTLRFIERRLRTWGHVPLTLHGGMTPVERSDVQQAFNAGGTVLLATDAASEGLNLHHRCRAVVHYELPWSPVRLQQRTGRVDRIGQTKRVHELLLVAADTAERLVLAPLAQRMSAARGTTTGAASLFASITESRVAAAVLDGQAIAVESTRTDATAEAPENVSIGNVHNDALSEAARVDLHRAWQPSASKAGTRRAEDGPLLTVVGPRRSSRRAGRHAIALFRLAISSADGRTLHSEIVPIRFDGSVNATPACLESLLSVGRTFLADRARITRDDVARLHAFVVNALRRREEAIAAMGPGAARALVQAGLFDRRALRVADARERTAAALLSQRDERMKRLEEADRLSVALDLTALLLRR